MKYLIYTNSIEAQNRADLVLEDMGGSDEQTNKYCDVIKHTADNLWAVVVDTRLAKYFTPTEIDSAIPLTYDWFPIIDDISAVGYRRISAKGTIVVKSSPGILREVIIGIAGTSNNKIIIYDNIVNSGAVIQQLSTAAIGEYSLNVNFNIGLTISNTLGTSADFTVYYE